MSCLCPHSFLRLGKNTLPLASFIVVLYTLLSFAVVACDDEGSSSNTTNNVNNTNNTSNTNNLNNTNNTSTDGPGDYTLSLGEVTPENAGSVGRTPAITFELPEGVISFLVVVRGKDGVMYEVKPITAPDGFIFNGGVGCATMGLSGPNRTSPMESVGTALVPNTDDPEVQTHITGGEYTIQVEAMVTSGMSTSPDTNPLEVDVLYRVAPAISEAGSINLNLWFTGVDGLTAETAPDATMIATAIEEMRTIYTQVGITIDEVRYFNADAEFQVLSTIQGAGSDYSRMLLTTEGSPEGVNLFMVSSIESPMGGTILGMAGGIPGPAMWQGTHRSGIAVVQDPSEVGASAGMVWAHEVGHFIGLWHTTEMVVEWGVSCAHDPISDTPESDSTYLMYYSGSGTILTAAQGEIMRANPMVAQTATGLKRQHAGLLPQAWFTPAQSTPLGRLLGDYDQVPPRVILDALGGEEALIAASENGNLDTYRRRRALAFLEFYKSQRVFAHLAFVMTEATYPEPLRIAAGNALVYGFGKSHAAPVLSRIKPLLKSSSQAVRQAAYRALVHMGTADARSLIRENLGADPSILLRRSIARRLARR